MAKHKIHTRYARSNSYGGRRRLSSIYYIVIHYTGCNGDTASANANYFATGNTRSAGAHYFIDRNGIIYKSVRLSRIAWSVGGLYTTRGSAGNYYRRCTNSNSVSIELCDIARKNPSKRQTESTEWLVRHIQKKCPNAKTIIRHYDVNGKLCPSRMTGASNTTGGRRWKRFKKQITS